MSGSVKLINSRVIKYTMNGGTAISIEWAERTTAWFRTHCAPTLQAEFAAVVETNMGQLPPGTTKAVMKQQRVRTSKRFRREKALHRILSRQRRQHAHSTAYNPEGPED